MDPWQQTVETRLGDLRSDIGDLSKKLDSRFLWLLGAFAAGFVLLGGLMLDRTDALSGKMDDLAQQVGGVRAEVAALRKPAP